MQLNLHLESQIIGITRWFFCFYLFIHDIHDPIRKSHALTCVALSFLSNGISFCKIDGIFS